VYGVCITHWDRAETPRALRSIGRKDGLWCDRDARPTLGVQWALEAKEWHANLEAQVNKLQADLAKSSCNVAAANKAAAASASAASGEATKALSIAQSNMAAIDALNAKIDQMFKRRPAE
jgi:hypothetical protein